MSYEKQVVIERADGELRCKGFDFVRKEYWKHFGTKPDEEVDHLFVAHVDGAVVGTLATTFWREDSEPRLLRIYSFDAAAYELEAIRGSSIEYGRWTASMRGVSEVLIYAASIHAMRAGKRHGWCEHTDSVHRVCLGFGLSFRPVQAVFGIANVPEGDKAFYIQSKDLKLYLVRLAEWVSILSPVLRRKDVLIL